MSSWTPISREELDELIARDLNGVEPEVRAIWERHRIEPVKWTCEPWGNRGGGFWAVARSDRAVVWYNDIEEGFNITLYDVVGVVPEYQCSQDPLDIALRRWLRDDLGPRRGTPEAL